MNEILNIIEKYEIWLQERISNFGGENICNLILLSEKGGTKYEDFKNIYSTIIASINYAFKTNENGKVVLHNNTPIENAFLSNIIYKIIYDKTPKNDGGYATNSGKYDDITKKMYDAKFIFYEKELPYPLNGSDSFAQTVWHELQHAYVQYNVLKQLYDKKYLMNPKMGNQRDIYHKFEDDEELSDIVKNTFYYTNINEINSHLNEMIPYLEKHVEINFTNYKEYLNEIPGYRIVQFIQKMYENLLLVLSNDINNKFREKFGDMILSKYKENEFYKEKHLTPYECVNRTVKRVSNAVIYSQNQFYKILFYTLKKLGRKQRYYEFHVRRQPRTLEQLDRDWEKMLKDFGIN